METQELTILRNLMRSREGEVLIKFLTKYITNLACTSKEASEIKGMCEIVEQLIRIPEKN